MARIREKISWVLSDSVVLDPTQNLAELKHVGSFWGSWRTWRACQTDNVICHDQVKAADLVQREFQNLCNLYIPETVNASLDRPDNVRVYGGEFAQDVTHQEEIVALHLAASVSDIVLLLGFDFSTQSRLDDPLLEHQATNYRGLVRQIILDNNHIQWVVVDHPADFREDLQGLSNLVKDNLGSILGLFAS
jgi:hypothetical protein